MDQTASGLLVIGWRLALALVAGIPILTTIGVFLLARFTHVFDAYAGERAKLLAQFHNLDRLVEQTERLTATTETIKARTSDEMWDRQMRWSYKRDLYVKIIERIAELIGAEAAFQQYEGAKMSTQAPLSELKVMFNDLMRLMEVAPLVLSDRAIKTLWNLRKHSAEELFTPAHLRSVKGAPHPAEDSQNGSSCPRRAKSTVWRFTSNALKRRNSPKTLCSNEVLKRE